MEKHLFGEHINYDHVELPFVLVGLFNRFDNRYQSVADRFMDELSWKQIFFLHGITLFQGTPTIKDLADFMGCSHQNANKLCTKLVSMGYVRSEQDAADKRKQRLYLTDKAEQFLRESHEANAQNVQEIFSVLTPEELEYTIAVMGKLTNRLEQLHAYQDKE